MVMNHFLSGTHFQVQHENPHLAVVRPIRRLTQVNLQLSGLIADRN